MADIAERELSGVDEREAVVFRGQLVGVVHALVARAAQRRLVRRAEHRRLRFVAYVALDLHPIMLLLAFLFLERERRRN